MSENPTTVISPRKGAVSDEDDQPTTVTPAVPTSDAAPSDTVQAGKPPKAPKASSLSVPRLPLNATAGVWAGLVVAALGFGTIFFSWIKVAATLDVGRQMPYVVSGAMTGLGMIVVGIAIVDMTVRRQDRQERRQQLATMRHVLEELRAVMDADSQQESASRRNGAPDRDRAPGSQ